MIDHISRIREQARKEAQALTMYTPEAEYDYLFNEGADWVLRYLNREQIARKLYDAHAGDLVSWEEDSDLFYDYADAVLSMIGDFDA